MQKVLIVNPSYLPGYKSGGPQRTVQNICDVFSECIDIHIVTMNVDFGETTPYDLETNVWLNKYGVSIMYVEPENYNMKLFCSLYKQFEVIYACGLFCQSTIDLLLINKWNDEKKLYVAPMGVFSKNALKIHEAKKWAFLKVSSAVGLFRKIIWSFTSEEEKGETIAAIGSHNIKNYIIAEDLPRYVDFDAMRKSVELHSGSLRIVFLSRIVPKKNLLYVLEILKEIKQGQLYFDIYGFQEDEAYWEQCKVALMQLPSNIMWKYQGGINSEDSVNIFSQYDIFLFPTQGENYGHVIYESLAAGCIPIISNTTPWRDFDDKCCGKVIELNDTEGFRNALNEYMIMDKSKIRKQKLNAIAYAENKYNASIATSGYRKIFNMPEIHRGGVERPRFKASSFFAPSIAA